MMTLEEAIRHCKETADRCQDECGEEHRQLAEWLQELQDRRDAEPGHLTDEDLETIRIHLSAFKEEMGNQGRWEEAKEYERIIMRLKAFANAQKKGRWKEDRSGEGFWICSSCGFVSEASVAPVLYKFCPRCGAKMDGRAADIERYNNWIPCSERLPEDEKKVLVSVYFAGVSNYSHGWNDHLKPCFYVEVAERYDDEWHSDSDEYKVARYRHKVVAWMPLPKPWEGKEE